jgi:hypothetical protein
MKPGSEFLGRHRVIFRAEVESRVGMLVSLRRIVPVRALPKSVPVIQPAARARLKAIVASTSQAALAWTQYR